MEPGQYDYLIHQNLLRTYTIIIQPTEIKNKRF